MAWISTKPFGVKSAHSSPRTSNLLLGASWVDACCLCSAIWVLQQSQSLGIRTTCSAEEDVALQLFLVWHDGNEQRLIDLRTCC